MTLLPASHLLFILLLVLQLAGGSAKAAYWLPEVQTLDAEIVSVTRIQFDAGANHGAASAWKTFWTEKPATERWNDEASRLIVKYRVNPLRSVRVLALLNVAMHDAGLRAAELDLKEPAQSAATHVAAARMLTQFFPLESPERLQAMGESALAALTAIQPEHAREIAQGASIGRGVARFVVLRALNDGADEVWDARTRPAEKPGMWRGVPPLDSAHPQEPLVGTWQTWTLKNGGEFEPPAPPASDSDLFMRAAQEVLEVSRNLTPEQKRIADYWHLDQGTVTPPGLWNIKARELAARWKLSEKERLRLLSTLNAGMMDASIACWHVKYMWWVQRPATMIQAHLDKTFMPYLVTPPHPSYVSGHATISGAAAEILKRFFPEDARQIDGWAEDAALSRLYGGIHYRFDNEAGLALGRQVGKTVLERALQ
ncbi:MAG: vanadium-dependent haloperoxidase [Burkholderiaceae bacterium]|nr:vanadium-dependent haloperoxidase [Burkholderiaceae bacterium]